MKKNKQTKMQRRNKARPWRIFLGQKAQKHLRMMGIGQKDIGTPTGQIGDSFGDKLSTKINKERMRFNSLNKTALY